MLLALSLLSPAHSCPTIATGTTSPLNFETAQVAIVRQGNQTTFSVSINPFGEGQGFALVLPVPQLLREDQVRTLEPSIFAALDGYSGARHVSDAGCVVANSAPLASDSDGYASGGGESDVTVEAEYLVGEYAITILSAEESDALGTWLDNNGYYLAPGAEPILAEYIEAGSFFLAAKVAEEAAVADGTPLSPLQIAYESDIYAIPIRLATLNSPGEQEMVIYAVTDASDGRTGISNYPEFEVPSGCIWGDAAAEDFGAFYKEQFRAAWEEQDAAAWTVEYAGAFGDCNPCSSVWIDEAQLTELGFQGDPYAHFLTRIHARYTPEQATQDLSLYHSSITTAKVTSYADDNEANRECIEACDGSSADVPEACSCGGARPTGLAALALGLLGAVRRRRR